ncbi:MAG: hypothetical protein JWN86_1543 [Planctomycetota bacterium]|nr:hypothetical protein [Planctomycetota bacterium]
MPVVSLALELRLVGCTTARQKTNQAEAILDKLRRHFNVSVADLGAYMPVDGTALGFAVVAKTRREAREILDRLTDAVAAHPRIEILKVTFDEL